jgi:hypothetical protein
MYVSCTDYACCNFIQRVQHCNPRSERVLSTNIEYDIFHGTVQNRVKLPLKTGEYTLSLIRFQCVQTRIHRCS